MVNAKQKGKRIELEITRWLKSKGFSSARRTQQFNGAEGLSDIITQELPDWHIECKGTKSPLLNRSTVLKWYEQVKRDCPESLQPVILNKANGKPVIAIIPYNVFLHHRHSCTQEEKIVLGESFYPALELEMMADKYKVAMAVGIRTPSDKIPLQVFYYMVEDVVLVFMTGDDWVRLLQK